MCYNAGESRVAVWTAARPGLDRDEFIDDIPFPETQGYVKRIISTAEDYRRLYADASVAEGGTKAPAATKKGAAAKPKPAVRKATKTTSGPRP